MFTDVYAILSTDRFFYVTKKKLITETIFSEKNRTKILKNYKNFLKYR